MGAVARTSSSSPRPTARPGMRLDGQDDAGRRPAAAIATDGPGRGRRARHHGGEHVPDDPGRPGRAGHGGLSDGRARDQGAAQPRGAGGRRPAAHRPQAHPLDPGREQAGRPDPHRRACSRAAGSTSTRWPSGRPTTRALSRITLTLDGALHPIDQVTKQLHKLVNVLKIRDLEPEETVARELALFKISADGAAARRGHADRRDLPRQGRRRHASAR